jgi:drug/metabolite transporter (DMT)-like permease
VIHSLAITQAQFYLPLPVVHTINFCAPIFIFIIDYFENGVRINKIQFYFLFLGIVGILCTINDELLSKLLNKSYEFKTEFKNYIHTDPQQFAIYSLGLCVVMFFWAYALLRVRTFYKNNHTHVNFHLGVLLLISSGFLYPNIITKKTDLYKMFIALFVTGLPLALSQLCSTASLGLNKKTGQLIILTGIPILIGYLLSYIRYGEKIQIMEIIGTSLIFTGLMGVIHCGESQALNNPISISKLIESEKLISSSASLMPVEVMLNTIKIA